MLVLAIFIFGVASVCASDVNDAAIAGSLRISMGKLTTPENAIEFSKILHEVVENEMRRLAH